MIRAGKVGRIVLPFVTIMTGVVMALYPWISNWTYDHGVASSVDVYDETVAGLESDETGQMWEEASEYNRQLAMSRQVLTDPFTFKKADGTDVSYQSVLAVNHAGVMCFIEIPKIEVYLPVYHGTSDAVLKKGAGHLEESSLPVGGESTHTIISAHTGLSTAKMFTDLTEMEEGDVFFVHVLNQTLAYEVYRIQTILPEETDSLVIEKGKDIVTLLTCTPYGVNSHRLLVTGKRTEYTEKVQQMAEEKTEGTQRQWMRSYRNAVLIGIGAVAAMCIVYKCCRFLIEAREAAWDGKI